MPYLVKADLTPPLYPEIIDEITRGNDTIVTTCINNAVAEVQAYMPRFDLLLLFGNESTAATVADEHLKSITKDVTCWQLIKMANPNIDVAMFRTAYEDAIKFLEKVMRGQASPATWPLRIDDPATVGNEGSRIYASSNIKRNNHW